MDFLKTLLCPYRDFIPYRIKKSFAAIILFFVFTLLRSAFRPPESTEILWCDLTVTQRCRSETETFILKDLSSSVLSQFKKYHLSRNLKYNNIVIFQTLELRILLISEHLRFSKNSVNLSQSEKNQWCYVDWNPVNFHWISETLTGSNLEF